MNTNNSSSKSSAINVLLRDESLFVKACTILVLVLMLFYVAYVLTLGKDNMDSYKQYPTFDMIEINLTTDGWNADEWIESGVSLPEGGFTWTDDNEIKFKGISFQDTNSRKISLSITGIYRDRQTVEIYANQKLLYQGIAEGECMIETEVPESVGDNVVVAVKLPDAVSPAAVSDVQDERVLGLMLNKIVIE